MSWTQHTPSRAASGTKVFTGPPAFTLASQQRIQTALTSVSTSNLQLTSYIKPWRAKTVQNVNVTPIDPWNIYIFVHLLYFLSHAPSCSTGKVLVHCIMGMSRSSTLVLAYLMLRQRLSLRDALRRVVQKRPIYPNQNFLSLLLKLDEQLTLKRRLCPLLWHPSLSLFTSFNTLSISLLKNSISFHLFPSNTAL